MTTYHVSETAWAKLQRRLAEPPRELPKLKAFLAEASPFTDTDPEEEGHDVQ